MVAIGTDVVTSRLACELAQGTGDIWATVGIHPNDNLDEVFNIDEYRALAQRERVVAIGEIGLDYFRTTDAGAIATQRERFEEQLQLASELSLPVVLHCRDSARQATEASRAHEDMISILRNHKMKNGIVHSFTGTAQHARAYIEEGFFIGLNGIITFVPEYHEMVRSLPFDRIVTETDAPYLAPDPKRGKKNEPLYMLYTIETLSKLHNIQVEQAKSMLFENARKALSIKI
jgi:TatD DNase family protein